MKTTVPHAVSAATITTTQFQHVSYVVLWLRLSIDYCVHYVKFHTIRFVKTWRFRFLL